MPGRDADEDALGRVVAGAAGGCWRVGLARLDRAHRGAKAAGFGLDAVVRWPLARDVLETGFGQVWLAASLLGSCPRRGRHASARDADRSAGPSAIVFLASAIAVTPALSGHARVEGSLAIAEPTAIHVLAAGVWVGGLALPCSPARQGRRRPLVARREGRASFLDARSRLGDRARRRRGRERLPRGRLLERAVGDDLRAAPAREGRAATAASRCSGPTTTGSRCRACGSAAAGPSNAAPVRSRRSQSSWR